MFLYDRNLDFITFFFKKYIYILNYIFFKDMESRQYFLDQNTGLSYAIVPEVHVKVI